MFFKTVCEMLLRSVSFLDDTKAILLFLLQKILSFSHFCSLCGTSPFSEQYLRLTCLQPFPLMSPLVLKNQGSHCVRADFVRGCSGELNPIWVLISVSIICFQLLSPNFAVLEQFPPAHFFISDISASNQDSACVSAILFDPRSWHTPSQQRALKVSLLCSPS